MTEEAREAALVAALDAMSWRTLEPDEMAAFVSGKPEKPSRVRSSVRQTTGRTTTRTTPLTLSTPSLATN